jgi:5,10-methenyltetrahydromethanopterin hydrogenase
MKVLRISSYDGNVTAVSEADWNELTEDMESFIEDTAAEIQEGPGGIINYVTDEDMYLVIPN